MPSKTILCDNFEVTHPDLVKSWEDDCRKWPGVTKAHITDYLIKSKACDGHENAIYKSLEAYKMIHSGWVGVILFHQTHPDVVFLKCNVRPSQTLSKEDYKPVAFLRKDGSVISATCNCMAGLGNGCSHVAAVLFKVFIAHRDGITGLSCTDTKCKWNAGTKRNVEPGTIESMDFSSNKLAYPEPEQQPQAKKCKFASNVMCFDDKEELDGYVSNDQFLSGMVNTKNSMFSIAMSQPVLKIQPVPELVPLIHENHDMDYSQPVIPDCKPCWEFYQKYVTISKDRSEILSAKTVDQAQDDNIELWKFSRKIRISSSVAKKVPKRENTKPDKFLEGHLYKPFTGNAATQHGQICEPIARTKYAEHYGTVKESGLVINLNDPWLCASPDGLVGDNKILEIKAPVPQDIPALLASGKYDVSTVKGIPELLPNGKNGYYSQVQICMDCTDRVETDFIVLDSSENNFTLASVSLNSEYVTSLKNRLRKFYFCIMLPKIVTDLHLGLLTMPREFKRVFES